MVPGFYLDPPHRTLVHKINAPKFICLWAFGLFLPFFSLFLPLLVFRPSSFLLFLPIASSLFVTLFPPSLPPVCLRTPPPVFPRLPFYWFIHFTWFPPHSFFTAPSGGYELQRCLIACLLHQFWVAGSIGVVRGLLPTSVEWLALCLCVWLNHGLSPLDLRCRAARFLALGPQARARGFLTQVTDP